VIGVSCRAIGILLAEVRLGRYHSQKGINACDGEATARGKGRGVVSKVGGGDGNDAFDARIEPHHTDATQPLLGCDTNQWEREAVQWMDGVSHRHGVDR
jgi:hypothetical protein